MSIFYVNKLSYREDPDFSIMISQTKKMQLEDDHIYGDHLKES